MIFSKQTKLSDDQAVTATALSTNVIDLGLTGTPYGAVAALSADVGKGTAIPFLVQVTTAFATLTSLVVSIEVSANADMSSPTVVAQTGVLPAAVLVAGKQISIQVLPNDVDKRYLAVRYTVAGSNATAGNVTAGITMGNQNNS
jgi:hypothetical protein